MPKVLDTNSIELLAEMLQLGRCKHGLALDHTPAFEAAHATSIFLTSRITAEK